MADAVERRWHFQVLLDGQPIGSHDFQLRSDSEGSTVISHASFKVTKLAIPLYRYEHRDQERWRGDCLSEIDAATRENGHDSVLRGRGTNAAFEVQTSQAQSSFRGCVWTYAYWDYRILQQARLLNAQTGDYESVEVIRRGSELIPLRGLQVPADHFSVQGSKFTIELWYSSQGEWLSLETRTLRGSTLHYELQ